MSKLQKILIDSASEDIPQPGQTIESPDHKTGLDTFKALSAVVAELGDHKDVNHLQSQTIVNSNSLPGKTIKFSDFSSLSAALDLIHSECVCYSDCKRFRYWKRLQCNCNFDCGCNY